MIADLGTSLSWPAVLLLAMVMLGGVYAGALAAEHNRPIAMLRYPRWMHRVMEGWFTRSPSALVIFGTVIVLNNFSLLVGMGSGLLVIGPPLAAFLTGFNVAVISFDLMRWRGIWQVLVNPVAWLEFPAAWLAYGLGMSIANAVAADGVGAGLQRAVELLPMYARYPGLLLLIAGVLETAMIVLMRRMQPPSE